MIVLCFIIVVLQQIASRIISKFYRQEKSYEKLKVTLDVASIFNGILCVSLTCLFLLIRRWSFLAEGVHPIIFISALVNQLICVKIWQKAKEDEKVKLFSLLDNITFSCQILSTLFFHCDYLTSTGVRLLAVFPLRGY